MSRRSTLETELQRRIELELGAEKDFLLLRNSVGHAKYFDEKTAKEWHVPYGLGVGSPDLIGILRVHGLGVWVCLEVKCPGEEPEPPQEKCHAIWRRFGALVYVVRSVAEARDALEDARATCARRLVS